MYNAAPASTIRQTLPSPALAPACATLITASAALHQAGHGSNMAAPNTCGGSDGSNGGRQRCDVGTTSFRPTPGAYTARCEALHHGKHQQPLLQLCFEVPLVTACAS